MGFVSKLGLKYSIVAGPKKYKMSKTYQIVDEESAKDGDFKETGFEYKEQEFDSLWDLAKEIRDAGATEASSSPPNPHTWYSTTDAEVDYRTGEETTYAFHPEGLSKEEAVELGKLLHMKG